MEARAHDLTAIQAEPGGRDFCSAFLDNELDGDEARDAARFLGQDPAARARWSEYCLIGDALRGELQVQPHLSRALREALDREPTVLAPMPRSARSRPALWLAAAAAVGTITWTLWEARPPGELPLPMASRQAPDLHADQVMPYLAAHQDYAQAVIATPEMQFTTVSLSRAEAGR